MNRKLNAPLSRFDRRTALIGALASVALTATPTIAKASQTSEESEDESTPTDAATPSAGGLIVFPDTPVGNNLKSWIAAINSGDADVLLAHYEAFPLPAPAETAAAIDLLSARQWGQLIVHQVDSPSETKLSVYVESTLSEEWMKVNLEIDGERIAFGIEGATPPDFRIPSQRLTDDQLNTEMTRYLKKLSEADVYSGTVLIARKGTIVFSGAYGTANVAHDEAIDIGTRFNLGSMNKMVTSVAIAQLYEAGKLAFTDSIADHLSDYSPEVAKRITIEQLLTHTSGLGDFFGPDYFAKRESLFTLSDYLPLFEGNPLAFQPGSRFEYSNAGYIVLGLIVERITGQSYFDYVREMVFIRAGMTASDSFERDADTPDLAVGYTYPQDPSKLTLEVVQGPRQTNGEFLSPRGTSAGGGYSTVEDLQKFSQALLTSTLLAPETVDLLIDGKVDSGPPNEKYGYGFVDNRRGVQRVVGHDGGAPGISSLLDIYWDSGTVFVSLSNYDNITHVIGIIANRFLRFD